MLSQKSMVYSSINGEAGQIEQKKIFSPKLSLEIKHIICYLRLGTANMHWYDAR